MKFKCIKECYADKRLYQAGEIIEADKAPAREYFISLDKPKPEPKPELKAEDKGQK
jgi:hypothetical protein